ncbi:MAG: SCO family protein [Rhodospirillales bacterium]|nr:SCO family protein [Rhodospirillales bacterium]
MKRALRSFLLVLVAAVVVAGPMSVPVLAAYYKQAESDIDPEIFKIDEKEVLGVRMDREFSMIGAKGERFTLRDRLNKPLILVFSYYRCDGICGAVNQELLDLLVTLRDVGRVRIGEDFRVLTVSFDKNDNLQTLMEFRKSLQLDADMAPGWDFAVAENPEAIQAFAGAVGYRFFWSPQDRTFFHPGAFMFLSTEGRVSRILYALSNSPKDVELAVLDAKQGQFKASEIINFAASLCYSYNFKEGRYTYNIPLFIAAGSLTLGVSAFSASMVVFRRRRKKREDKEGS